MNIITDPEYLSGSPLAVNDVFRDRFGDLQDLYEQQQINDPVLQLSQDWLGYLGAYDTTSGSMDTEPPLMRSTKTICRSILNILVNTSISYLNLHLYLLYRMVSPKLPHFALKTQIRPRRNLIGISTSLLCRYSPMPFPRASILGLLAIPLSKSRMRLDRVSFPLFYCLQIRCGSRDLHMNNPDHWKPTPLYPSVYITFLPILLG
jgi:hypothetical protein